MQSTSKITTIWNSTTKWKKNENENSNDESNESDTSPLQPIQTNNQHKSLKKKKKNQCNNENNNKAMDDWISLNVGGSILQTTRGTLCKDQNSMLYNMFSPNSNWISKCDNNGAYLLDRDPRYFAPLLNFLRHGEMVLDKNLNAEGVLKEAEFFQLEENIRQLKAMIENSKPIQKTKGPGDLFLALHRAFYLTERVLSDYLLLEGPVEESRNITSQLEGCSFHDGIWVLTHSRLAGTEQTLTFTTLLHMLAREGWNIVVASGCSDGIKSFGAVGQMSQMIWGNTQYQTYILSK